MFHTNHFRQPLKRAAASGVKAGMKGSTVMRNNISTAKDVDELRKTIGL
jgi:hypothetical protein